jgi:hypothetical protein
MVPTRGRSGLHQERREERLAFDEQQPAAHDGPADPATKGGRLLLFRGETPQHVHEVAEALLSTFWFSAAFVSDEGLHAPFITTGQTGRFPQELVSRPVLRHVRFQEAYGSARLAKWGAKPP